MTISKRIIIAGTAAGASIALVASLAHAQTGATTSLVDRLASRFNLNKADVQKVFDENRQAKQADREQNYETMLNQAVTDGKLTADQKSKILAKHKELVAQMETDRASHQNDRTDWQSKTPAERQQLMADRRAKMEQQRTAIQQWEKDNGIPSGYLMPFGGRHGFRGRGMGASPTSTADPVPDNPPAVSL